MKKILRSLLISAAGMAAIAGLATVTNHYDASNPAMAAVMLYWAVLVMVGTCVATAVSIEKED